MTRQHKFFVHGFTMLELIVVILIISVLSIFVAPKFFSRVDKAKEATAKAQLTVLSSALNVYRADMGSFPSNEQGLSALVSAPSGSSKWTGPYLNGALPLDPWDRPYIYRAQGQGREFELLSYGQDGAPGGTGLDADLSAH